jgi:Predicted transcriptional regulators
MGRKAVIRELPRLIDILPDREAWLKAPNRGHAVEKGLRRIVASVRGEDRLPFYSMREVAAYFDASLRAVSAAYEKLNQEGLLTIVRGSKTILEGRRQAPKTPLRGVVGVPIALPSFLYGNNPRQLFILFEEELRRLNYVVDFIFYATGSDDTHQLAERLLSHDLDTAVWIGPPQTMKEAILRLDDAGIPQVIMCDGPAMLPLQGYTLDLDRGFREAAAGWHKKGLRSVHLVGPTRSLAPHFLRKIRAAYSLRGFRVTEGFCEPDEFFSRIERVPASTGLVFLEHFHYEMLCNHDWRTMRDLFLRHRTLLAQGPVHHHAFHGTRIPADTLDLRFSEIAVRLARDITTRAYLDPANDTTFATHWAPDCDLGSVRREI